MDAAQAGHHRADGGKHLAADLPGIVTATPWIGDFRAGECHADGIDDLAAHRIAPKSVSCAMSIRATPVHAIPHCQNSSTGGFPVSRDPRLWCIFPHCGI